MYVGPSRSGALLARLAVLSLDGNAMPTTPTAPPNGYAPSLGPPAPAGWERRERTPVADQTFEAVKARHAARRSWMERAADRLAHVASAPSFLLVHVLWFVVWIVANSGVGGVEPFDPYPYGLLTLALSMEAIVLSIFVLMSQGREAAVAELREEITLQVNLRIEAEVTKTLQLVNGLYARLGFPIGREPELREMLRPLDAAEIEQQLAAQIAETRPQRERGGSEDPPRWDGTERRGVAR